MVWNSALYMAITLILVLITLNIIALFENLLLNSYLKSFVGHKDF